MGAGNLADSVGGILELHYGHPALGPLYPIRLAVTAFDPSPGGAEHDYAYTGAGLFLPGEAGVLATFAHVAACWAPYYDAAWSLELALLYQNVAGVPMPLPAVPVAAPVAGSNPTPVAVPSRAKRSVALYSALGDRWRVWLRQLFPGQIGETLGVGTTTGGLDARDRAWYAYAAGPQCACCGRDGQRFQPGGKVRAWWDSPPAPYLVSG